MPNKKCVAEATHEKHSSVAATQISHLPQKHAKIEPVFLPKIKIHALVAEYYEICVA